VLPVLAYTLAAFMDNSAEVIDILDP